METARTRGHLMAEAGSGKDATMLAIIAGADEVRALLDAQPETDGTLVIANDNGPRQVVVAGHIAEIENVERAAGEAGLRTKRLTVASAFHSPIVAESSAPFAEYLNTLPLGESHLTVYANATAQPYGDDPTALRARRAISRPRTQRGPNGQTDPDENEPAQLLRTCAVGDRRGRR